MIKLVNGFIGLMLFVLFSCSPSGHKTDIYEKLQSHVKYLSTGELGGRLTGTSGDSLAAVYIRNQMKAYGLKPLTDDGIQRFDVKVSAEKGINNYLTIQCYKNNSPKNQDILKNILRDTINTISFHAEDSDFTPAPFSGNGEIESEMIFAGYGFRINTDSVKRDDYSDIDVTGECVLVLRGDGNFGTPYLSLGSDYSKVLTARELGARGVLLVSGEEYDREDNLEPLTPSESSAGIPVIRIKRKVADFILQNSKNTLSSLEKKLNESGKPFSFKTGCFVKAATEIRHLKARTGNVVMFLPGEDSLLKKEYIIIGAHYDHLGMGGKNSSSRTPDTLAVHHGADDNASGTAMLIELAGKFSGTKGSHKRSILFTAFTGEEKGLLGSKYFADNPPVDLSKVNVMINLDMVGRLKDTKAIQVGGTGTAAGLQERSAALIDTNLLKPVFTPEGTGPSDHSAFYGKDIPVLFITTGAHIDYHTPSDTWDKLNYPGMVTLSDYVYSLATSLACDTPKLAFRESGSPSDSYRRPGRRGVSLGIMPDVTGSVKNGLRADLVTPGKPADLGGMKKGDVITAINGKPVGNIEDYMFRLSQLKKGDAITVEVLREGKKIELLIQL